MGYDNTKGHAHRHISVFDHLGEFFEADLAVAVEVSLHDGLVNNLLQLLILQIAADHHLEDDKEFAVADVAIPIDIVDFKGKAQLLFLVSLGAESAEAGDELLEVDISTSVFVEDGDHAGCERVRRDLREGKEFVAFNCARVIL